MYTTLDYWSRDMPNFNFPEKGLGLVCPPHFADDFSRKLFLIFSHYILLTDQISLSDSLYFSRYWAICALQLFFNQAVTFCYMTKKSRQKLKSLENEKSFWGEIKGIFIIFKGLSIAKNFLRPECAPLKFFMLLHNWQGVHFPPHGSHLPTSPNAILNYYCSWNQ